MTERFGQFDMIDRELRLCRRASMTVGAEKTMTVDRAPTPEGRSDRAKRQQILEGARRMFLAQGFDAASMGAIAREAGVSKGTLYVYFKSKEELIEAIVEDQCRVQAEQIFSLDQQAPVASELQRVGEELTRFLCRPDAVPSLRTIIAIADRMPEVGARFYASGPARGIASLQRYLEDKVAAGVLVAHDCEVAAAQFIDACVSTTFKPMLFNAAGPPAEARIRHVVGMAVRTLLAAYERR
jgi:AcrR family transcriptional regulator